MLVVKIELWPYGRESHARELGRMYVANDGDGSAETGSYVAAVCRENSDDVPREIHAINESGTALARYPAAERSFKYQGHARALGAWILIAGVLEKLYPKKKARKS